MTTTETLQQQCDAVAKELRQTRIQLFAEQMRVNIMEPQVFGTLPLADTVGLVDNLKALVDAWEAEKLKV